MTKKEQKLRDMIIATGDVEFIETISDYLTEASETMDRGIALGVEYGFKSCEEGNNLEKTMIEFNKLLS